MSRSQIPNVITALRILLVLPAAWFLCQGRYAETLAVVAVAGASDILDGELARRFGWRSAFGAMMDPIADKLLVATVFVLFAFQGHIPLWLVILVIARDVIILAGAGVYRLWFGELQLAPSLASKANTAMQIFVLSLLLLGLCEFGALSEAALKLVDPWSFQLLAVLGVGSGAEYVFVWSRKAWRNWRAL